MTAFPQWDKWKNCKFETGDFSTLYNPAQLVYLTADSENIVEELDESKVYIIGGLVDRNRHKNICFKKATELGIATARLPIDRYIDMKSRSVLTINQGEIDRERKGPFNHSQDFFIFFFLAVFEILSMQLETKNWEKTLISVIPGRKGAKTSASTSESPAAAAADDEDDKVAVVDQIAQEEE